MTTPAGYYSKKQKKELTGIHIGHLRRSQPSGGEGLHWLLPGSSAPAGFIPGKHSMFLGRKRPQLSGPDAFSTEASFDKGLADSPDFKATPGRSPNGDSLGFLPNSVSGRPASIWMITTGVGSAVF